MPVRVVQAFLPVLFFWSHSSSLGGTVWHRHSCLCCSCFLCERETARLAVRVVRPIRNSGFSGFTPDELRKIMQRYGDWRRSNQARIAAGNKLTDGGGRVLRNQNGRAAVTDGPFTEAKEVMGGLFVIEADHYDHAIELAKTCPHREFGSIEIRGVERTGAAAA